MNYLQRMSGIATITSKYVEKLEGTNTKLLDSRKTIPNLRILDKYSVKVGGDVITDLIYLMEYCLKITTLGLLVVLRMQLN